MLILAAKVKDMPFENLKAKLHQELSDLEKQHAKQVIKVEDLEEGDSVAELEFSRKKLTAHTTALEPTRHPTADTRGTEHGVAQGENDTAFADRAPKIGVIWEVSFLPGESVLSAYATRYVYTFERQQVGEAYFKQSIRNGLKNMLHPIGFRMSNSRSGYFADLDDVIRAKDDAGQRSASVNTYIRNYLSNFRCNNVDTRRAARWLKLVLLFQHFFPITAPQGNVEDRAYCTPLLFIEASRLF